MSPIDVLNESYSVFVEIHVKMSCIEILNDFYSVFSDVCSESGDTNSWVISLNIEIMT